MRKFIFKQNESLEKHKTPHVLKSIKEERKMLKKESQSVQVIEPHATRPSS